MENFPARDLVTVNPHSLQLIESAVGMGQKLVQRTIGPFEVTEQINSMVYRLKLPSNYPMNPVINFAHLRRYHASPLELGEQNTLPDTREVVAKDEREVNFIVAHRLSRNRSQNRKEYLVCWKVYKPTDDTWIPEHYLRNAHELLRAYKAKNRL